MAMVISYLYIFNIMDRFIYLFIVYYFNFLYKIKLHFLIHQTGNLLNIHFIELEHEGKNNIL